MTDMKIKLFASFFEKMNINVSDETVRKLYKNGFDTLLKIIGATKNDLLRVEGIKEKSAERIVENIKNGLQNVKATDLLGASSIFGRSIGRKKITALMNDIPDLLVCSKKGLKERILEVDSFSDITAKKILDNLDFAIEFIDNISNYVSFANDTRVSNVFVGKIYVFSGFRDKSLEQKIIDRGGKCTTSVSKKTSGVILASKGSGTSKENDAIKLGIPIYTKDEFSDML